MDNEIWKAIDDFDGYLISNMGRVKNIKWRGNNVRYLKPQSNENGYLYVNLYKNSTKKFKLVHRLVAQAFIPNPENKPEVDHIDTKRDNPVASNLRWCTTKENKNNPITLEHYRNSVVGEKNPMYGKSNGKKVILVDTFTGEKKNYNSLKSLALENSLDYKAIRTAAKQGYLHKKKYKILYEEVSKCC